MAAVRTARERGALTIAVANSPATPLLDAAEFPVAIETGAEAIAGSTRMKAGTAQKAALNLFSTAVMVRLGRVYRGQMVDMQARNAKLRARAVRMLRAADRVSGGGSARGIEGGGRQGEGGGADRARDGSRPRRKRCWRGLAGVCEQRWGRGDDRGVAGRRRHFAAGTNQDGGAGHALAPFVQA